MTSPLLAALLCVSSCALVTSNKHQPQQWNKLILTHHWPQTFCILEHCDTHVNYWTLHGFWPDKGDMCNSSWHFNRSEIEDLIPEMTKWWPDLLSKGPSMSAKFWKHEWQKHGTCAVELAALNSEHKYFGKALELYHKLDLDGLLKKAGIVPGDTPYTLEQIEGTIVKYFSATPKIQCAHNIQKEQRQQLGQIEICFDKLFQLTDCERNKDHQRVGANDVLTFDWSTGMGYNVCDDSAPVFYPPLQGTQ